MANEKIKKVGRGGSSRGKQPTEPTISEGEVRTRIAEKAYQLYERRGRISGQEVQDWLEAERVVMAELGSQSPKTVRPGRGRRIRSNSG